MNKKELSYFTSSLIRFYSKIKIPKDHETCWEWTAFKRVGYGQFKYKNKNWQAHRFMWELFIQRY